MRAVRLLQRTLTRIPTATDERIGWLHRFPRLRRVACVLPGGADVRDVLIADRAADEWIPVAWTRAIRECRATRFRFGMIATPAQPTAPCRPEDR